MSFYNKLHYAAKRIKSNLKMGVFTILIMVAAMVMLYSSMILFEGLDYGENAVKNSLSVPITSCGIIDIQDDVDWDEVTKFIDRIYALDEIKAIGNYDCYGFGGMLTEGDTDYWNEMLEIQNAGEVEFEDDGSCIQTVLMNCELLDMENIDLIKGEKSQEKETVRYQILLGYNFREIPLGTVFKDDYCEYEVTGIMKKGTYVTDPQLFSGNLDGLTMGYKVNVDNMILMLMPKGTEVLSKKNIFCVNDGYTYEDAVKMIEKVGDENGIRMRIGTLQARLDTVFADNQKIKGRIDTIALIICIAVFVISVTAQLLNIYLKRNELGIWLANGMSRREVFEIVWLENFIKVTAGVAVAVIAERILLRWMFRDSMSVFREVLSIMYGKPLGELVVFAFLLVCIISIIPIAVIARKSTTELVKGVWN